MKSSLATRAIDAIRAALRGVPEGAVEVRIDEARFCYTTVRLCAPTGDLLTCTVARRQDAPRSRQLTIDDVLARGAKPPAPAADTPPAPPARSPATVADDRGEDWGEDGREYRDGVCIWDSRDAEPPPAYPAPTKTAKPAKGKLYRDQGHALDRSHAHPNVAYLAGPGSDMERPKGLDDAVWRALVAQTITEAPGATWRLYSAKGKCLWDSRDGGAP